MIHKDILSRIPKRKKTNYSHLASCMDAEINIYNQAQLSQKKRLEVSNSLPRKSNNELAVTFKLEGELQGNIVCLINLANSNITQTNALSIQSLITESMNILLGKFLTNLEEETGLMSMLSSPRVIAAMDDLPSNIFMNSRHDLNLSTQYKLITATHHFNCLIYIQADKTKVREV